MTKYDERHGGPYDRGGADSWYRRSPIPHYWTQGTGSGIKIEEEDMTPDEIKAYFAGYDENESSGCHKDWF